MPAEVFTIEDKPKQAVCCDDQEGQGMRSKHPELRQCASERVHAISR
jgi:hypothetical protein